jgi:rhamnose utilization protein RhaD (predicted bifunctional aldolase and dehydrogenase)
MPDGAQAGPRHPADRALRELAELSAWIGSNVNLIQGAGGNTSVKLSNVLWVKASGAWLAEARDADIFVPVDLGKVHAEIFAGSSDPGAGAVIPDLALPGRRPSIETTLHALLRHPVVVHTHSVGVIAAAVRKDAVTVLEERLAGLSHAFVPYARPGLPLTNAVKAVTDSRPCDVLVLGNHGLVVGAADCAAALKIIDNVEQRLAASKRPASRPDMGALASCAVDTRYIIPDNPELHFIATDPTALAIATGGSLYPDHVVFLGPGVAAVDPGSRLSEIVGALPAAAPMVIVRGAGILLRNDLTPAARAMVKCLADVLARIPADAPVNYLTVDQEAELMDWDAEKLRQAINCQRP